MNPTHTSVECEALLTSIMTMAGDCRLRISHVTSTDEWERFHEQAQIMNDIDREIQQAIDDIGTDENASGSHVVSISNVVLKCVRIFDKNSPGHGN
jgi:hypothetical protein